MDTSLPNARARALLATAGWTEDTRRDSSLTGQKLLEMGFIFPDAARRFLDRYGGLYVHAQRTVRQSNQLLFHTDALEVANHVSPESLARWEDQVGARLCPLASAAFGDYMILMDAHERSFGIDQTEQMTFWTDLGVELIEMLCGCGPSMRPVSDEDATPPTTSST